MSSVFVQVFFGSFDVTKEILDPEAFTSWLIFFYPGEVLMHFLLLFFSHYSELCIC